VKAGLPARQGSRFPGGAGYRAVAERVNPRYLADEAPLVRELADLARVDSEEAARIRATAIRLVDSVRKNRTRVSGLDAFLQQYDLSSQEGVVLMCLAEALLRVPDKDTADRSSPTSCPRRTGAAISGPATRPSSMPRPGG
jgi:hypothetical protein